MTNAMLGKLSSLVVTVALTAGAALAGTYGGLTFTGQPTLWTGGANDGDWTNPNNWSNTVTGVEEVPTVGNTALFFNASSNAADNSLKTNQTIRFPAGGYTTSSPFMYIMSGRYLATGNCAASFDTRGTWWRIDSTNSTGAAIKDHPWLLGLGKGNGTELSFVTYPTGDKKTFGVVSNALLKLNIGYGKPTVTLDGGLWDLTLPGAYDCLTMGNNVSCGNFSMTLENEATFKPQGIHFLPQVVNAYMTVDNSNLIGNDFHFGPYNASGGSNSAKARNMYLTVTNDSVASFNDFYSGGNNMSGESAMNRLYMVTHAITVEDSSFTARSFKRYVGSNKIYVTNSTFKAIMKPVSLQYTSATPVTNADSLVFIDSVIGCYHLALGPELPANYFKTVSFAATNCVCDFAGSDDLRVGYGAGGARMELVDCTSTQNENTGGQGTGHLQVGVKGRGEMLIRGGSFATVSGKMGIQAGSDGSCLTVSGGASYKDTWGFGLGVGSSGNRMIVCDGACASSPNQYQSSFYVGGESTTGNALIVSNGTFEVTHGALRIRNGNTLYMGGTNSCLSVPSGNGSQFYGIEAQSGSTIHFNLEPEGFVKNRIEMNYGYYLPTAYSRCWISNCTFKVTLPKDAWKIIPRKSRTIPLITSKATPIAWGNVTVDIPEDLCTLIVEEKSVSVRIKSQAGLLITVR